MRLRENFLLGKNGKKRQGKKRQGKKRQGKKRYIKDLFHQLANDSFDDRGVLRICGVYMYICGYRTKKGELLILASHGNCAIASDCVGQEAAVI